MEKILQSFYVFLKVPKRSIIDLFKNKYYFPDHDGAEPSPNAVSALNLLRLGHYFDDSSLHDRLRLLFKSYARQLSKVPMTMPTLVRCFDMYTQGMNEIIIQSSNQEEIIRYIQTSYIPNLIIFPLNKNTSKLVQYNQQLRSFVDEKNEQTKIFLCRNFQCQLPLTSFEALKQKLDPLILTYQ
jgi:uncharacterized protein YyaL (SSP411 family)